MSRDIATTILRTVSAWAASPYLTLSSLVTPSTSSAISSPNSRRSSSRVYAVSSMVSCSSAAQIVSWFMPSSARIVATASGWVMYGSPLLRSVPECCAAATSYACSTIRTSALGCVARIVLTSGSSTGLMPPRGAPSLASLRRTDAVPATAVPAAPFGACGPGAVDGAARRLAAPDLAAPDSAAPGSAAPDSAAPGSAAPGSASPGWASPGLPAMGRASPGLAVPDLATRGLAARGLAASG